MKDKRSQDKWEKFITSPRWKWKRQNILRRDGYIDQYILRTEGRQVQADLVHHILPKEKFPQYAMEDWNLISVSRRTHTKILHNLNGDLTKKGKALMTETAAVDCARVRSLLAPISIFWSTKVLPVSAVLSVWAAVGSQKPASSDRMNRFLL